jgi:hypothetical protein
MRITESALRRIVREELREMKDDGSHKHHSGDAHRPFGNRPYPPGPPFRQPKLDDPGLEDKYKQMCAGLDTDDEPDADESLFEGDKSESDFAGYTFEYKLNRKGKWVGTARMEGGGGSHASAMGDDPAAVARELVANLESAIKAAARD